MKIIEIDNIQFKELVLVYGLHLSSDSLVLDWVKLDNFKIDYAVGLYDNQDPVGWSAVMSYESYNLIVFVKREYRGMGWGKKLTCAVLPFLKDEPKIAPTHPLNRHPKLLDDCRKPQKEKSDQNTPLPFKNLFCPFFSQEGTFYLKK